MQDFNIQTQHVHFNYLGQKETISDLNIAVPTGAIYGFLGHNGAGKSTTIQLLLGLLHPKAGEIHLFGQPLKNTARATFNRIGALIESPTLYEHLSAKENLQIAAKYRGVAHSRIPQVLATIGLEKVGTKKVNSFSMGMKQRLGLGLALIHDPELIFLDEPTNGLDPQGIIEMRAVIRQLNEEQGKTIFISSHLLSEIELLATHVGIIKNGRQIFEGRINELQKKVDNGIRLLIQTSEVALAKEALRPVFPNVQHQQQHLLLQLARVEEVNTALQILINSNIPVYEAKQLNPNLEDLFLDITKEATPESLLAVA